jgi:hypothetical protein
LTRCCARRSEVTQIEAYIARLATGADELPLDVFVDLLIERTAANPEAPVTRVISEAEEYLADRAAMSQTRSDGTHRPAGRTDFHRALTPGGASFESAEGSWHVRLVPAGELALPSGRIIATDPCYLTRLDDTPPFVRTVPPGRYPVWLALARKASGAPWAERVACMVLQLREEPAILWELALRPGERLSDLPPGHFYGHGVDSGNACFVDATAVEALDPALRRGLYLDGVVRAYERTGWRTRFVHVPLPGQASANVIACSSGYGDGCYPS